MKVDVLLGLQWGDEGKGKVVDVLTPTYDIIGRFQGGPNAGHTLEFDGIKHVLHTIPSGIFHDQKINVVGNGVVIDPVVMKKEITALEELHVPVNERLFLSKKAHLILPTHRLIDAASEKSKGKEKIGSTLRGIGPAYMDKTGRNGMRIGDLFLDEFESKYRKLVNKHLQILKHHDFEYDLAPLEKEWMEGVEAIRKLNVIDSEYYINKAFEDKQSILAEGAQGTLLDIDFGSYPYVTSSNTVTAGTCTGLGLSPQKIGKVFGIFKAYCTRVGSGPFLTELFNEEGETLRKNGNEFGATTGRPRRCGWLDLPALKYAVMINGVTDLIMTKADVLSSFEKIKVCTAYEYHGETIEYLPYDNSIEGITPIYRELPGWSQDLTNLSSIDQIPGELDAYIKYLENELSVPITIVSVGPNRNQTLHRNLVIQ